MGTGHIPQLSLPLNLGQLFSRALFLAQGSLLNSVLHWTQGPLFSPAHSGHRARSSAQLTPGTGPALQPSSLRAQGPTLNFFHHEPSACSSFQLALELSSPLNPSLLFSSAHSGCRATSLSKFIPWTRDQLLKSVHPPAQ
jgi:hypothetical protein